jgi:uncharacterized membrane protein YdjX (TVP38/TMEM64 family)
MTIFSPKERLKKVLTWLWSFVIVFVIIFIIYHPEILSATFLQKNINHYQGMVWPIYLGLLLIRVPLLIPPTPLLFLGLLLFPESKLLTVMLVMISSLISATFFYYFAGNTGWYRFLFEKYPKQTKKAEILMNKANAVWIVVLWSFIPIAPGDLICYIAGIVRMPFRVLLIGVVMGQLPLMLLYAYMGHLFL